MSFYLRDAANGVRPVELLTFTTGQGDDTRVWRYCTGDRDVTVSGLTYRASTFTREKILRQQNTARTACALTCALGTPFVQEWLTRDPFVQRTQTGVTMQRVHMTDAGTVDTAGDTPVAAFFVGTVAGVQCSDTGATIQCTALDALLQRPVPTVPILRTCPWAVYSLRCGILPGTLRTPGVVTALGTIANALNSGAPTVTVSAVGSLLTLDGAPDIRRYDGGMLTWDDGARTVTLAIESADVTAWPSVVCIVDTPLPTSAIGDDVRLVPGCSKTYSVCTGRFGNGNHFGGFPHLPERNPMLEGFA